MKKISEAEFNKAQKLIEDYEKQKQSLKFEKEIEDFAIAISARHMMNVQSVMKTNKTEMMTRIVPSSINTCLRLSN